MPKPQTTFPPPLIIPPLQPPHKQTFILLHGRGSNPSRFGPPLLTTPFTTSSNPPQTLPTAFPHAKFIFPTAPRRRATIYKRTLTTQWFDGWHVDSLPPNNHPSDSDSDITTRPSQPGHPPPATNDWLMIDGLRETTAYLHALLREEIALLSAAAGGGGAGDIVLGGISQGGAASLVAMALWDGGEALGAVVGMCGWLPFVDAMEDDGGGLGCEDGGFDPFEREGKEDEETRQGEGAVEVLREMLEFEPVAVGDGMSGMARKTPVFLGHGVEDEAVPLGLGRRSAECLGKMEVEVEWKEYRGLGHWYSEEMLGDMVGFLKGRSGFSL
ncbi:phospholipase/carboxylesterase family protein-like protein [Podospora conica]|nr:phospholipase/carboxylesterase family protein-like protein [Schizothecium conicum]